MAAFLRKNFRKGKPRKKFSKMYLFLRLTCLGNSIINDLEAACFRGRSRQLVDWFRADAAVYPAGMDGWPGAEENRKETNN
jgi:hypothetical protein